MELKEAKETVYNYIDYNLKQDIELKNRKEPGIIYLKIQTYYLEIV